MTTTSQCLTSRGRGCRARAVLWSTQALSVRQHLAGIAADLGGADQLSTVQLTLIEAHAARSGDASMNSLTGSVGYRLVRSLLFGRSVDLRNISYLLHGLYGLCARHQWCRSTAFNGAPSCDR